MGDALLSEYIRRGRPGDHLTAQQCFQIVQLVFSGQDAYRLESRQGEGVPYNKWILDNGVSEIDITEHLQAADVSNKAEHVLRIKDGRAVVLAKHCDF